MGYRCYFVNNEEYSAADVNEALAAYVTSGIEDVFADGTAYHVSELNGITVALSTAGIVPETVNSCKCILRPDEKSVYISPGTVFLESGCRMVFDAEGVTLSYEEGKTNYVYVIYSEAESRSYPMCSTEAPTGDFVMLAQISEDSILTDKRKYARGKLPGYQSNAGLPMYIKETVVLQKITTEDYWNDYAGTYTIHLGENHTYSILIYNNEKTDKYNWGYYDIRTGITKCVYITNSKGDLGIKINDCFKTDRNGYSGIFDIAIENTGSELNLNIAGYQYDDSRTIDLELNFTIY